VPVRGQVVEPVRVPGAELDIEAWARPIGHPVPYGGGPPQTVRIEVVQVPAAPVAPPVDVGVRTGPSWLTAAGFMAVVCVLLAIGVGLWLGGAAPWQTDAQQQRHSTPAHHRAVR
jgi:hypothetical protein